MFKGITPQSKEAVEKYNNLSSDDFIFSFGDLELVEISGKRRKCRLLSDELSKELRKIYSKNKNGGYIPPIKFIDFEPDWQNDEALFLVGELFTPWNYDRWARIKKVDLCNFSSDGVLVLKNKVKDEWASLLFEELIGHSLDENNDFINNEGWKISCARTSAIQSIENTIQNGNIDFTTLEDAVFFLGEDYIGARPSDCLHCSDPEELTPELIAKYYQTHINKCLWRPDRINDFKDRQIALIERIITKFNDYKKEEIQEVIEEAQEQDISEAELNNNRPGWQNTLFSLTNREKIHEYFADQLEEDIKRLVDAKNKSVEERQQAEAEAKEKAKKAEERLKKEREEQEKKVKEEKIKKEAEAKKKQEQQEAKRRAEERKKTKQQELSQKRNCVINKITAFLNQTPFLLTNQDLSPGYHNWETQINQLTDIQKITNLQDRILANIQTCQKEKKSAQEAKENLNKTQTGTEEEKKQAWENLEKQETQKGYKDNKEEIEKLKKEKATENPQKYSEEAKRTIKEKLKSNEVKEEQLSAENKKEWQKLKNGEIKSPDQLVSVETKIKQDIYQKEAVKKVADLTSKLNKVLKLKSNKELTKLKKELLEFISSDNIYYSAQKKTVENLLAQLENYLVTNNNQNNSSVKPESSFGKIIIPSLLIGTLLIAVVVIGKGVFKKNKKSR